MGFIRVVFRGIRVLFLLWLGLHLWFIFSPVFLPGPPAGPGTFAGVETSLPGLAEAQQAGPEAEAAYRRQMDLSKPFDNSLVIYYLIPVLLVRLFCGVSRRLQLSSLAIVASFTVFWFAIALLFQVIGIAMGLILPSADFIGRQPTMALPYIFDGLFWQLVILGIGILLVIVPSMPGFLFTTVFYLPRRVDRAMAFLLNEEQGWLARHNGPDSARIGHILVLILLAGIGGWAVWRLCDSVDGGGLPDTFGLVARIAAVAYSIYLLIRAHLEIVDYQAKSPDGPEPAVRPQSPAHTSQLEQGKTIRDDASTATVWRRDR